MALPIAWTAHLRDPQKKQDFEQVVRNSTMVLDRVRDILLYKLNELDEEENKDEFFEELNLQARFIRNKGRRKAFLEMLQLLTFSKDAKTSG